VQSATALVVIARDQSFQDPITRALEHNKVVIAQRLQNDPVLPPTYPFAFTAHPAVLRFVGEPRRQDTASAPWPMPEPLAIAGAIYRAASATPELLTAAGTQVARYGRVARRVARRPATPRSPAHLAPPRG
jgi:hypothetical protein